MKIPPIAIIGGLGALALIALGGSRTAKAADVGQSTGSGGDGDGPPGPGTNPGGTPPYTGQPLVAQIRSSPEVLESVFGALGYVDYNSGQQVGRFQAHYNMVSREGGRTIEGVSIPNDLGGVDVTYSMDDATSAALASALAVAGGAEYVNNDLKPFLESMGRDEESLLIDTPWLDVVRAVAEEQGQWLTVEWIDAGAQPDYDFNL